MSLHAIVLGLVIFVLLAVLAGGLYQWFSARRDRQIFPPPGFMVQAGDGRVHGRCAGAGSPPVIFEAGIAASSITWSSVQPSVAEFTRACSYDRAGLAWSDPMRGRPTLAGLVDQLRQFQRACSLASPCVMVGHSFGTFVVRAYAAAWPAEVAGLVLVDPITTEEWMSLSAEQSRRLRGGVLLSHAGGVLARAGVVRVCLKLLAGGATAVPRRFAGLFGSPAVEVLGRLIGEVQKLPAEALPSIQALWCRPQSFQSMAAYLRALPACALELAAAPALENIPLVILSAANASPDRLREHAALARQSTCGIHRVASRGGHWIHLDEPSLVISAIHDMVNGLREKPS